MEIGDYTKPTRDEVLGYLHEARENMGSRNFMLGDGASDRIEAMGKVLGMLYLYCPEDLQMAVYSTLYELQRREDYTLFMKKAK